MTILLKDLRFTARTLVKSPVFTGVAILSLALGIGANTTIFTLINAVFLNPLPVKDASRLLAVYTVDENNPGQFSNLLGVSWPNYEDYRDHNQVFTGLAAYSFPNIVNLSLGEEAEQIFVELVTANYFEVLGVEPARGRFFLADESESPGGHPVAVIAHGLWERQFGADPDIVGRTVKLNGHPFTVVGVAPPRFKGVNAIAGPEAWVPAMMYEQILPRRFHHWFDSRRALFMSVAGRLEPEVDVEQAEAHLKTIAEHLEQEYPEPNTGRSVTVVPLAQATLFPGLREALLLGGAVLMTVVGLVLLIACSNVANLLLARATTRRKEVAIRLSLGAGRGRLMRQLLTESMVLALLGGAVGLLVAHWGRSFIWSLRPPFLTQNFLDLSFDGRVLGFTVVVAVLTGVLFGLVPAFRASRPGVVDALKEETRTAGRRRRVSLRGALVVGQVALSFVALIAAGLFLRSLAGAHEIDPGFETEKLAVVLINPGQRGYDEARTEQLYRQVVERIEGQPGVRSVSLASNLPLFGGFQRSVFIEGQEDKQEAGILVQTNNVEVGYFETVGMTLLRGRGFTAADREDAVPVAVVNQKMAEQFWPGQEALGQRFRFYGDDFQRQIVGIVENAKYVTLGEEYQPCAFLPLRQEPTDAVAVHVRSEGEPGPVLAAAQRQVRALDPQMPITFPWTVSELIDQSLWASRLGAALLTVLGMLALVLASVGLYGVMAYAVSQRNREIGVRMALGARAGDVLGLVLRQGMSLVVAGVAIGLVLAILVSRVISTLLYGISANDPLTFAAVSAVLVLVAFLASYLPARRATRVDPVVALRY